jgi:hypothetical protein
MGILMSHPINNFFTFNSPQKMSDVGMTYLSVILDEGHVFPTCRIIENTLPVFFTREHLTFSENSKYVSLKWTSRFQ